MLTFSFTFEFNWKIFQSPEKFGDEKSLIQIKFKLIRWVVKAKVIVIHNLFWVHSAAIDKMTY